MKTITASKTVITFMILVILATGCISMPTSPPEPIMERDYSFSKYPTLPASIPELIGLLSESGAETRIRAARRLGQYGAGAASAVPALTINLYYDGTYDVREAAAWALGEIGSASSPAVPVLITVMLSNDIVHVRRAAADALGKIGDKSALFALVQVLDDDDTGVSDKAASSIGILASQSFPDMESDGFRLDENGIPLIVIAAKDWWKKEGQYQNWVEP